MTPRSGRSSAGIPELKGKEAVLDALRAEAKKGTVTLLYGARDKEHNQAVAFKALLES